MVNSRKEILYKHYICQNTRKKTVLLISKKHSEKTEFLWKYTFKIVEHLVISTLLYNDFRNDGKTIQKVELEEKDAVVVPFNTEKSRYTGYSNELMKQTRKPTNSTMSYKNKNPETPNDWNWRIIRNIRYLSRRLTLNTRSLWQSQCCSFEFLPQVTCFNE